MEKMLLVGAGGFGRVVLEYAQSVFDCAFVDDNVSGIIDGVPVVGTIKDLEGLFGSYKKLIVTIGDNFVRERIYNLASDIGYSFPNIILPSVHISSHASVGCGCVFLNNVVIQNNAVCGSGVILNSGVELHHGSFVDDYALIYSNSVIRSSARVGKRAWIGSTLSVGNDVVIRDDERVENGCSRFL